MACRKYISPLFSCIVLASAIPIISSIAFLASQFLQPLAATGDAALIGFRGVQAGNVEGKRNPDKFKTLFMSLFPVIRSIVLVFKNADEVDHGGGS